MIPTLPGALRHPAPGGEPVLGAQIKIPHLFGVVKKPAETAG